MQVQLTFRFPPTRHGLSSDVQLPISVPFPQQRLHAVANFVYMCTGELLDNRAMEALSNAAPPGSSPFVGTVDETAIKAAEADGLVPLSRTAVVHIDLHGLGVMELGSSTTKTIFGGFIPDEPLRPPLPPLTPQDRQMNQTVEQMHLLRRGTLLCGNAGTPNTQASRYYLVLQDINDPSQAAELQSFAPLGFVSPPAAMEQLCAALQQVPVHQRTLAPLKKVELAACSVALDCHTTAASATGRTEEEKMGKLSRLQAKQRLAEDGPAPLTRIAGRTRGRDEDEEEEGGAQRDGGTEHAGFFNFDARFPTTHPGKSAQLGGPLKRRRVETAEREVDVNTAIAPADGEAFDYFKAQELAFGNDIADIKHRQEERQNRKMRRLGKNKGFQKELKRKSKGLAQLGGGKNESGGMKTKRVMRKKWWCFSSLLPNANRTLARDTLDGLSVFALCLLRYAIFLLSSSH
eukprot:gene5729-4090_t